MFYYMCISSKEKINLLIFHLQSTKRTIKCKKCLKWQFSFIFCHFQDFEIRLWKVHENCLVPADDLSSFCVLVSGHFFSFSSEYLGQHEAILNYLKNTGNCHFSLFFFCIFFLILRTEDEILLSITLCWKLGNFPELP